MLTLLSLEVVGSDGSITSNKMFQARTMCYEISFFFRNSRFMSKRRKGRINRLLYYSAALGVALVEWYST